MVVVVVVVRSGQVSFLSTTRKCKGKPKPNLVVVDVAEGLALRLVEGDVLETVAAGGALEALWVPSTLHGGYDAAANGQTAACAHHLLRQTERRDRVRQVALAAAAAALGLSELIRRRRTSGGGGGDRFHFRWRGRGHGH